MYFISVFRPPNHAHTCIYAGFTLPLHPGNKIYIAMKKIVYILLVAALCAACHRTSRVEQYRAEKHIQDSIALGEQERSLAYYQQQLELLTPQVDSLMTYFKYERNEKYQDHGYYVVQNAKLKVYAGDLRIMVRDDAQDLVVYRNGKRLPESADALQGKSREALECAQHLQTVMADIHELENRIRKTSLEVQKYQKRLQKN